MKKFFFFCGFLLFSLAVFGQTAVRYDLEAGVSDVEKAHREAWENIDYVTGFRIQLMAVSGPNSRNSIEKAKNEFKANFPNIPAYILWEEPFFRLRVGDFYTRIEALKVLNDLKLTYEGAYVITDKIEFRQR